MSPQRLRGAKINAGNPVKSNLGNALNVANA